MPINFPIVLEKLSNEKVTIEAFRNWRKQTKGDSWRIIDELDRNSVLCWSVIEENVPVDKIVENLSTSEYDSLKREGFDFNAINPRKIYAYKSLQGTDMAFTAGKETGVLIANIYAHIKDLKAKLPYAQDKTKRRWFFRVINIQKRILLLLRHVRAHDGELASGPSSTFEKEKAIKVKPGEFHAPKNLPSPPEPEKMEQEKRSIERPSKLPGDALLPQRPTPTDDLTLIEGIGPKVEELLNDHGIYNFRQLINTEIEKINDWLNERGWDYMDPKDWPYQAELADNAKVSGKQKDQDKFEDYKAWVKGGIDPDEYSQVESDRSKGIRKPPEEIEISAPRSVKKQGLFERVIELFSPKPKRKPGSLPSSSPFKPVQPSYRLAPAGKGSGGSPGPSSPFARPRLAVPPRQRTLNTNFADRDGNVLRRYTYLNPDKEYDLLVDVGLPWDKIPNLLHGKAFFPEDRRFSYLSQDDREKGWFDVEVVFVSQDFIPNLVRERMCVPVDNLERSTPYVNGKLNEKPGPVRLSLRTPKFKENTIYKQVRGRLSLYYGAQVLQSAYINAGVVESSALVPHTRPPGPGNKAKVDYVLTPGFDKTGESIKTRERNFQNGKHESQPVKVGLMINDDLVGTHRILLKVDGIDDPGPSLPPAWKSYNSMEIDKLLSEVRQIMIAHMEDISIYRFKADLAKLATLGSQLYSILLQGITPAENVSPLVWRKKMRETLQPGDVIQLARAGTVPPTHIIPWALVYDQPLEPDRSDKPRKICRVVDEQWEVDVASRKQEFRGQELDNCPYEGEHDVNVICPYGFWGLKYTLEQPISALSSHGWDIEPAHCISTDAGIQMAVASTQSVPEENRRLEHFSSIQSSMNSQFTPGAPATHRDQVRNSLRGPDLFYILCHGGKKEKITYLSIGPDDKDAIHTITPDLPGYWGENDYIDLEEWTKARPLVFINGCHTADLLPELTLNFVSAFRDLMAGGVIGTEINVTFDHGYLAAEKFFERLGRGEDIGQAILGMRWDLLDQGSFIGLAYTAYGMSDLHLEVSKPKLICVSGEKRYQHIPIEQNLRIGHHIDNNLRLIDRGVSKRHAEISLIEGNFFIEDKGSTNGTRVNSKKIPEFSKVILKTGDQIAIGPAAKFIIEI